MPPPSPLPLGCELRASCSLEVNESDHDTDSEFEIGQNDMQTDTNVDYGSSAEDYGCDEGFICKDKVTKWYKNPHVSKFAKTRRENIVKT